MALHCTIFGVRINNPLGIVSASLFFFVSLHIPFQADIMFPLLVFGPVVAPLVVAVIVFIVIAAITGTISAEIKLPTPVRVGLAFLIGGLVAAKSHSWARGRVDKMLHTQQQLGSYTQSMEQLPQPSTPAPSSGGLPPINVPAHLIPQ